MIDSLVLGKPYETERGYKLALNRCEIKIKSRMIELHELIESGRVWYVGRPTVSKLNECKKKLEALKAERKKYNV